MTNTVLTNAAMWALIVGFFSPIVVQQITKRLAGNSTAQALAAFVYSAVVAFPTVYFAGNLNGVRSYVTGALIVLVATVVSYEHFWRPLGVTPGTTGGAGTRRVV